ncbi:MAG: ABC transporter permease [Erysipelotrichaceae bacterium]
MIKYILRRILQMLMTLFLIVTILFLLLQLTPGSPFNNPKITPVMREQMEEKYGLNEPVIVQYGIYISKLVRGDLGESMSIVQNYPVLDMVVKPMKVTVLLGAIALVFGSLIGIVMGAIAALNKNKFWDHFNTVVAVLGISVPAFVVAMLLLILQRSLNFIPIVYTPVDPVLGITFLDSLVSLTLPVLALSFGVIASISRYIRTELVEVYNSDFILLARSKGLNKKQVFTKHAFRNALVPIVTIMGPMVVGLITGSVVVEVFFGVPGLSNLLIKSINVKDTFVTLGCELMYSLLFVTVMLLVDIAYGFIDPRIRLTGGKNGE